MSTKRCLEDCDGNAYGHPHNEAPYASSHMPAGHMPAGGAVVNFGGPGLDRGVAGYLLGLNAHPDATPLESDGPTSESLGPVVNPDGSPSAVTLAMFGRGDTLPRWYVVQGTRHTLRPDGYTAVRDVPTFYLCANVQGITSADAAVRIAHDILGTTDETATLWAYAAEDIGR